MTNSPYTEIVNEALELVADAQNAAANANEAQAHDMYSSGYPFAARAAAHDTFVESLADTTKSWAESANEADNKGMHEVAARYLEQAQVALDRAHRETALARRCQESAQALADLSATQMFTEEWRDNAQLASENGEPNEYAMWIVAAEAVKALAQLARATTDHGVIAVCNASAIATTSVATNFDFGYEYQPPEF